MIVLVVASTHEWICVARTLGLPMRRLPGQRIYPINAKLRLLRTGVGTECAERAGLLLEEQDPTLVLHVGYAGALRSGLNAGDLLAVTSSSDEVLEDIEAANGLPVARAIRPEVCDALRSTLALLPGRFAQGGLLTVSRFIHRSEDKLRLGAEGSYVACDMEATLIRAAAERCGAEYVGLRVISDSSHHELPPGLRDQGLHAVFKWLQTPGSALVDSWHMFRGWRRASSALEKALSPVLESLEPHSNELF